MNIEKILKKFIIFLSVVALMFGVITYKEKIYLKLRSDMQVTKGYVQYATDPQKYYNLTLHSAYILDPDWKPIFNASYDSEPIISAHSGLMVDLNSNKVLYSKNSEEKMKIASITKIMTALVALEHKKLDDTIYITRHAAYIGEDTMFLTRGEVYTLKELLYGLLLNSGNDAAYAIADGVAQDSDTFVKWMNIKATEIGLNSTKFADPSGLDDETYSTALDLVKLTKYALKNPVFKEIVKTRNIELTSTTHKYLYLENQTNLLTSYPGVEGVKTGYTEEAGLCLVTYYNKDGREIIGVVLNSIDRKGDMTLMLDTAVAP